MLSKRQAILAGKNILTRIYTTIIFVKKILFKFGNRGIRRRTPTVLQMEATECGAAVGIMLGYYAQRFAGEISDRIHLNDKLANQRSEKLATTAIASMLVLVVGGLRVMDGNLSIGMLVAFQGLMHIVSALSCRVMQTAMSKENVVESKKSATAKQVLGGVACSG